MLRVAIILVVLGAFSVLLFHRLQKEEGSQQSKQLMQASPPQSTPGSGNLNRDSSIFVPYWTLDATGVLDENYSYIIYFGVAAGKNGIDTSDPGYASLTQFTEIAGNKSKFLTVRMVDSSLNSEILKSESSQRKIIADAINIAQEYGFNGIVLDLEMSSIGFDEITNRVTAFNKLFYTEVKKKPLKLYTTMYGDTYYRVRPYNLKDLEPYTDQFLIMAYDFHKSRGNPGPNFPLNGKEEYGYDFKMMIDDFLREVPAHKLTVIFGMFGYDWQVDKDNKSVGNGEGKSTSELRTSVVSECDFSKCEYSRHTKSSEMQGSYIDMDGKKHIIWYEDEKSVEAKKLFLKQKGIEAYSYWAYSYF